MNAPLLPVGKIIADSYPVGDASHLKVSKDYDTKGISIPNTVLYRENPKYVPGKEMPVERLIELSQGEIRLSKCHVMFGEGKELADEILYLRAEVARLSKSNTNQEEDS